MIALAFENQSGKTNAKNPDTLVYMSEIVNPPTPADGPIISVIIPMYNAEGFFQLKKAIQQLRFWLAMD